MDGKSGHVLVYFLCHGENGLSIGASSAEITGLLKACNSGDQAALARLAERVYPELRLMARRYVNPPGRRELRSNGTSARSFFAMAAQMMRRILVDAARTGCSALARRTDPFWPWMRP